MQKPAFPEFLAGLTTGFTPVVDAGFSVADYVAIDLSVDNEALKKEELSSSDAFSEFLRKYLQAGERQVAYGGYNEKRNLYRRSGLFSASEDEDLVRNVHLGIDVWAPAGTAVLAAFDGKVHSFKDNASFGDYGPTIILEHMSSEVIFFTLYGHLSRTSLEEVYEGKKVQKGEKIAELGAPSENGDYAPHLHFQIIRNLGGRKGDYPGVASKKELPEILENCPDPNLLLKLP